MGHWWNELLAEDAGRSSSGCGAFIMSVILGGRHRWNEMLFHDLHHAFPNRVGTMSQRGRFHGWYKVHEAAHEVIAQGLFKKNGDAETKMEKSKGNDLRPGFKVAKAIAKFHESATF